MKKSDAKIGFNMVAAFGYNASAANLADFAAAFPAASAYLFDVSDGQMFFDDLTVFDDHQHYADADIQLPAGVWPHVDGGNLEAQAGPSGTTSTSTCPAPASTAATSGARGRRPTPIAPSCTSSRTTRSALTTNTSAWTAHRPPAPWTPARRGSTCASIIDSQYTATEYRDNSTHNPDTEQGGC